MTQTGEEQLEREKEAYFDPDTSLLAGDSARIVELTDEIRHLRAAGRHWRDRAVTAEKRADDLQKTLNANLASQSAEAVSSNGKPGKVEASTP